MKKLIILIFVLAFSLSCFALNKKAKADSVKTAKPKITFLELGSDSCIPCKKMKPILKSIEEKYGSQIKVEFIDIRKKRQMALKYKVRVMPTQVFLNENGKEIFRNMGYYPEQQIDTFLQKQGLVPIKKAAN